MDAKTIAARGTDMEKRDAPPVDEDDPSSQAVEIVPEKIDLQKKPQSDRGHGAPQSDSSAGGKLRDRAESR